MSLFYAIPVRLNTSQRSWYSHSSEYAGCPVSLRLNATQPDSFYVVLQHVLLKILKFSDIRTARSAHLYHRRPAYMKIGRTGQVAADFFPDDGIHVG